MENTAKFDSHIRSIVKKGTRIAGWSLRVFSTRAEKPMLTLFKALVLSHVEYCSALWAPRALGMIRELESVQRSFTKRIEGMHLLDYHTRLQRLKLYSLERRRDRYIIIYIWRIINGFSPNLDMCQIRTHNEDGRRGLECVVPPLIAAGGRLQTIRNVPLV